MGTEDAAEPASVEALGLLYRQRYPRLLRVAESLVGNAELAHDVVQEAFALAIRSRADFRGDGSLEGWVWRILVNTAHSAIRDRLPLEFPLEDRLETAASSNGGAAGKDMLPVLAELPERQRLVLFLRYYADLDYRQIAEALEIQLGTVGATLNHAHTAIRRRLDEVAR